MLKQNNSRPLQKQIHHGPSDIPWWPILSAGAILVIGGAIFFSLTLPKQADSNSSAPAAAQSAPDESLCSRQTWPYIDQRCAQRVNAAPNTRQVRIVTDKGTSVTAVTPLPIVEPVAKPAPPKPAVAQNDRPIGPPAAPTIAEGAPQVEQVATTAPPAEPPQPAANAMAQSNPNFAIRDAPIVPPIASSAPVGDGTDFFDGPPPKKSKAERAAEKRENRDAKRLRKLEARFGNVPPEVIAEVERATALAERGRRIIVPHDFGGGW